MELKLVKVEVEVEVEDELKLLMKAWVGGGNERGSGDECLD